MCEADLLDDAALFFALFFDFAVFFDFEVFLLVALRIIELPQLMDSAYPLIVLG
jgi:hypothetical protein